MSMQEALDALETIKAARVAYKAQLTSMGYTHVKVERYESYWSAWVHPQYLSLVNSFLAEGSYLDKADIEEKLGHVLPQGAILEDVWLMSCSDTRPEHYSSRTNPWD